MSRKPTEEPMVAVNTRIPERVHDNLITICNMAGKPVGKFISEAVEEYIELIKNPKYPPSDNLKINRYAWSVKNEKG